MTVVSLGIILGLGTEMANTHLVGRDADQLRPLLCGGTFVVFTAIPAATITVFLLHSFFGETVFLEFTPDDMAILVVLTALQIHHLQLRGLLLGIGRFGNLALANLIQYLTIICGVGITYLSGLQCSSLLVVWLIGLLLKSIVFWIGLPWSGSVHASSPFHTLRIQIRLGLQMMLGNISNIFSFRFDAFLIAYFLPIFDVGVYAVATTVAESILYIPKAIGSVVFSWSSRAGIEQNYSTLRTLRAFQVGIALTFLSMIVIQLSSRFLLPIFFGSEFRDSISPTMILAAATAFFGVGYLAMMVMFGRGEPAWNMRTGLLAAAINAGVNLVTIPYFGIMGAAWTSFGSYALYGILNLILVSKCFPENLEIRKLILLDTTMFDEANTALRRYLARNIRK
jgi:O-antigen/teichoic acid export membrane protein